MYRPSFRNLFSNQRVTLPRVEQTTLPGLADQQIEHIEALYDATKSEFLAAQSLDDKMRELEAALTETRELIRSIDYATNPTDEQKFVIDLVRLKEEEIIEIEAQIAQKRSVLEAATQRTNELAQENVVAQFETDLAFVH